jgi:short/branched chain acyl-CoA dehydrogenase
VGIRSHRTHGRIGCRRVQNHAVRDGNEWVINGSKIFITNAASDMTLGVTVQAITGTRPNGKPEYTCFIVENGTKGFKAVPMKKKMMWRASNTAELYFRRCSRTG